MTPIGILKEIKNHEYRVALTPDHVAHLTAQNITVFFQKQCGVGCGFSDEAYEQVGAIGCQNAQEVFDRATIIVKVKEPQAEEIPFFKKHHCLFAFLHLAPDIAQTQGLLAQGTTAIGFETVEKEGKLPLLAPMSIIAGKLATQVAARFMESHQGGVGLLMGGAPGVDPVHVVILGAGNVGWSSLQVAHGMGARVSITDRSDAALQRVRDLYPTVHTYLDDGQWDKRALLAQADVLIGAALLPGAKAPHLVSRADLALLKPHCLLVDVAIDQGGCFESSVLTRHDDPVRLIEGRRHYAVPNMPGSVARTSSEALSNVIWPYVQALGQWGWEEAVRRDESLAAGLQICRGHVCCAPVAQAQGLEWKSWQEC